MVGMVRVALGSLGFVLMFCSMAFLAALLLSCGQLFHKLPRRHRLRPLGAAQLEELRARPHVKTAKQHGNKWMFLAGLLLSPVWASLLLLVIIPAIAAMYVCAVCQNYRYVRRAVYHVLRRRNGFLA